MSDPVTPPRGRPGSGSGDRLAPLPAASVVSLQRSAKRRARSLYRGLKIAAWMAASAVVIPIAMIAGGVLFGPRGYEGVFIAPLAVLSSWALILFVGLRRRATPRRLLRADVRSLPAELEEWLDRQRPRLPAAAGSSLEGIGQSLEVLQRQVEDLPQGSPAAGQLRSLLLDDLAGLVRGYLKVPAALQHQALHGGASPEARLLDGLRTLDGQLRRVRDQLAAQDLHSLATHQRYLELKYDDEGR